MPEHQPGHHLTFGEVTGSDEHRCPATVFIPDDRMGGFKDRCDLVRGHPGPHASDRGGNQPPAWLSWLGSYDGDER